MKIMDNGVIRDMTPNEETIHNAPCPAPWEDLSEIEDYENALVEMGVDLNGD